MDALQYRQTDPRVAVSQDRRRWQVYPTGKSAVAKSYNILRQADLRLPCVDDKLNAINLGFERISTPSKYGIIVHECVHAIFDMRSANEMTIASSESTAYVAQCIHRHDALGQSRRQPATIRR